MSKTYRYLILILFLALLGFVIYPIGILPVKNIINQVINPLSSRVSGTSNTISDFFSKIKNIRNLSSENQQLKNINLDLESQLAKLEEIKHENELLKEELGFSKQEHKTEMIISQIIGRSPSGFSQNLKIDKGSDDNIEIGQPVVSHGYLIGVISEVTKNNSSVLLITASNSLIPVILQESRGTGLLQGGLQGLQVREIPIDIEIKPEENVLTSGLGGDLLQGLPIGTVGKVISTQSEIFQKISINSPIDFNRLEVVFVVK